MALRSVGKQRKRVPLHVALRQEDGVPHGGRMRIHQKMYNENGNQKRLNNLLG